jgi:hypothetical protein
MSNRTSVFLKYVMRLCGRSTEEVGTCINSGLACHLRWLLKMVALLGVS